MVRIKNVKKDGNILSCDYYPEQEKVCGHIVFDAKKVELLSQTYEDEIVLEYVSHRTHACKYLLDVFRGDAPLKKEIEIMWY